MKATKVHHMPVTIIGAIIGTNTSPISTPSALTARAVGPPQGRMFIRWPAIITTQVSTSRFNPRRWYSGSMAAQVIM